MLLAGIGNVDSRHRKNFFLVDESEPSILTYLSFLIETQDKAIEDAFEDLTTRKEIAILLINQHVCL